MRLYPAVAKGLGEELRSNGKHIVTDMGQPAVAITVAIEMVASRGSIVREEAVVYLQH